MVADRAMGRTQFFMIPWDIVNRDGIKDEQSVVRVRKVS